MMKDYHNKPITVAEAIKQLRSLPQNAYLATSRWDLDYGIISYSLIHDLSTTVQNLGEDFVSVRAGLCKEDFYTDDESYSSWS
jgi:hypothetical protein